MTFLKNCTFNATKAPPQHLSALSLLSWWHWTKVLNVVVVVVLVDSSHSSGLFHFYILVEDFTGNVLAPHLTTLSLSMPLFLVQSRTWNKLCQQHHCQLIHPSYLPPWQQSFNWLIRSQTTRIWSVWTMLSFSIFGITEKQIN